MNDARMKTIARRVLGGSLIFAGVSHLTFARRAFRAQVPEFVPLEKDTTVVLSGLVEVALGSALVLAGARQEKVVSRVVAGFFVGVFPGNVSQYVHRRDAFGLDTDGKRLARLFLQPVLVWWALRSG
jgi:uncharacterized membrane protein